MCMCVSACLCCVCLCVCVSHVCVVYVCSVCVVRVCTLCVVCVRVLCVWCVVYIRCTCVVCCAYGSVVCDMCVSVCCVCVRTGPDVPSVPVGSDDPTDSGPWTGRSKPMGYYDICRDLWLVRGPRAPLTRCTSTVYVPTLPSPCCRSLNTSGIPSHGALFRLPLRLSPLYSTSL